MNLFTKQEQIHRLKEQTYWLPEGNGVGRERLGIWDWHVHTAISETDNQQGPTI